MAIYTRWVKIAPTIAATVRCSLCRQEFQPGLQGAATFTDTEGAVTLRLCHNCVPLLVVDANPNGPPQP